MAEFNPAALLAFTVIIEDPPSQNVAEGGVNPEIAKSPNGQQLILETETTLSAKLHSGIVLRGKLNGAILLPSSFKMTNKLNGLGRAAMSSEYEMVSVDPGFNVCVVALGPVNTVIGVAAELNGLPA